jgi:hypothetical protein
MPHADHGRIDIDGAVAHLLEQRPELFLIHEARIPECAITLVPPASEAMPEGSGPDRGTYFLRY